MNLKGVYFLSKVLAQQRCGRDYRKKVIDEKIKRLADSLSTIEFTTGQKIGLGVGAVLLLFSIIKYPKYSWIFR